MSAKGEMGATKYQEKGLEDPEWTSKTYHIADDLKDPKKKALEAKERKLKFMEQTLINRPNGFMR